MVEVLAKADALDGQSDKIVSLCASCALGMDGSKEHQLHVGEYTMYFCRDDCQQAFSEGRPQVRIGHEGACRRVEQTSRKAGLFAFGSSISGACDSLPGRYRDGQHIGHRTVHFRDLGPRSTV